jgi:pyruvate dehydrogenase E2 component (dihydrolipoamide acetyltransferase)
MAVDVRLPQIAVDTHEGTLVRWIIKVGDSVNQGDPIAEVETAKTVIEVDAPSSGTLLATVADEGANIVVGEILAWIGKPGETPPTDNSDREMRVQPSASPVIQVPDEPIRPRIRATPIVMRLAIEREVDITTLKGTGPNGRITKDDVERAVAERYRK